MPRARPLPPLPNPAVRRILRQIGKLHQRLYALLATEHLPNIPTEEPPPGLLQLTPTEWRIWRRIADPKEEKYPVIYTDMGMSKRNFDKHVGRLFKKLGVHGRPGAARLWDRFGKGLAGPVPKDPE